MRRPTFGQVPPRNDGIAHIDARLFTGSEFLSKVPLTVQFLWSLVPGAREARNQVLIGYAWLVALGLWIGVPHVSKTGNLHDIAHALGHVGLAVALSFAAYFIGSLSDDLATQVFRVRGALSLTSVL